MSKKCPNCRYEMSVMKENEKQFTYKCSVCMKIRTVLKGEPEREFRPTGNQNFFF